MEPTADKVKLGEAEVAAEQADGLNEEVIQSSTTHPPGSLPPSRSSGSEAQGAAPSAGQPDESTTNKADANATDKVAADTSPDGAKKTNRKFIVHLKRLSAPFVPRPSLTGHLKEGELEKMEQTNKEQQELQNAATAEGQKESQTQQAATGPDDATQPCSHRVVDTSPTANTVVSPPSDTARPRKTPLHTVTDIQRRLSHAFRTPLYHHASVGEEKPAGDAKTDKQQPPTPVTNQNGTSASADVASPAEEMPALPDKPEPVAAATTATATNGAGATDPSPAAAAPTSDEEKPTKRHQWQGTLKDIFRGHITESKFLHPGEWTHGKKAQQQQQQKDTPSDAPAAKTTSEAAGDELASSPPSVGFFSKMKQAIKDEFGKDFPASDRAQAQGKTRKKIGTVRVHLNEGKLVAAERLSGGKKKKGNKQEEKGDANVDADGTADETKKKKKGDEDDKSPKGPPSIPTEHAIYSQDVGAGQHQQQQQQQTAPQTVAPVPPVNVVDS